MNVEVVEYNPDWKKKFEEEKIEIENILKDKLVDIHHIGSTSVEGLCAKPIIDIMVVVDDLDGIDDLNESFEALGYECMGEFGIKGRRFYRKGINKRSHHIHLFGKDSINDIDRHLAFRNYLRENPEKAREYAELKLKLAKEFPEDIESYCDGKDSFIKDMERVALFEYYKLDYFKL